MADSLQEPKMVVIYALSDPRRPALIRYIGKTKERLKRRLDCHIAKAKGTEPAYHKSNWIRKLLAEGLRPLIWPIEVCSGCDWKERERHWISLFKPIGLTNTVPGGGGGGKSGWKWSSEALRRISDKRKGRVSPAQLEHLREMQKLNIGRPRPANAIEQARSKIVGSKRSPETCERISAALTGTRKNLTDEQIEKKRQWAKLFLKWPEGAVRPRPSKETIEKVRSAQKGKLRPHVQMPGGKPVLCIETGEVFVSIWRAAQAKGVEPNKIRRSIKLGHATKGLHWRRNG